MYDYVGTVLCVEGGWLYEAGIMSFSMYKKLNKLFSYKRRGGNGRTALIEYDSIPQRFRDIIENQFGNPHITQRKSTFNKYLETDQEAQKYFNNYTLDSGTALPDRNIKEYTANASVLNAIFTVTTNLIAKRRTLGGSKVKIWDKITAVVQDLPKHTYPHTLPVNERRLKQRLKKYKTEGYESLIHKNFCNRNSEKLCEDAKEWIFARWCDRVKKVSTIERLFAAYNRECENNDWKPVKDSTSIRNYLYRPEIENLWHGYRYGELKSKEKYTYQHTTQMSSMRDSLWYSDGTKLNFYYLTESGKKAKMQVYEVMDTFSEAFLGYHISASEDYDAQFQSYKMAVQIAGHKPYELKFDGQGGHGKLKAGNFLNKLSKFATKTQPYNGKSKTIESAFGRFQTQIMAELWYFTGQNITATKEQSKANMEFILANEKSLPTLEEVKTEYLRCRMEWNDSKHHETEIPRMEMYFNSDNPETPEITMLDMIDLFWITREKSVTCTPYGISFKETKAKTKTDKKKTTTYQYAVYGADGLPDFEWLANNVDRKFFIKYDPSDRSLIYLYTKDALGLRRVGSATTKVVVHRNRQEQEAWEQSWLQRVEYYQKINRVKRVDTVEKVLKKHKMSAEDYGLKNPKIAGIKSTYDKKNKAPNTIGQHQKELSNMEPEMEYEDAPTGRSKY